MLLCEVSGCYGQDLDVTSGFLLRMLPQVAGLLQASTDKQASCGGRALESAGPT